MLNFLPLLLFLAATDAQPKIELFTTGSSASLRGLCAVSEDICWTSGSEGTVLLTLDGGTTWEDRSPAGYDTLQFRDIHAFNKDTALVLSAGLPGVICKTTNGGKSWKTVYENSSEGVFFDAFDFWDQNRGIAFSDAQDRHLLIIATADGGESWDTIPKTRLPEVAFKQGGFAASGTCLKTFGKNSVIIGLGGPSATTLLSTDNGQSWTKGSAPLDHGNSSSGIFSFDVLDETTGLCVGGDYTGDAATGNSAAFTRDGGHTWQVVQDPAVHGKYRSCVNFISDQLIIVVGHTGISYTTNGGQQWETLEGSFYSVSTKGKVSWLSGDKGRMGKVNLTL